MRCLHLAPVNLMSLILLHSDGSVNSNSHRVHDNTVTICVYLQPLALIVFFREEYIYFPNM